MSCKSLKCIVSRMRVRSFLRKEKSVIPVCSNIQRSNLTPIDVGVLPHCDEYKLENPKGKLLNPLDGIHFVGISFEKHIIDMCINRIHEDVAFVWVYLKLADGSAYKLPSVETRRMSTGNETAFLSSGLFMKCLSPMRKWRISYNGLLENCKSEELVHAKFSFVWHAMSGVQEQNLSYNDKALIGAFMAQDCPTEIDSSGLDYICRLQNKYDQWGQMMGTVSLNGGSEKEFYFWSNRTRILGLPQWDRLTSVKFYVYFMNGMPVKMESISVDDFVSNLTSGFSVSPTGAIKQMSSCNFNINLFGKGDKETNFSYVINGKENKVNLQFTGEDTTVYTGPSLQLRTNIRPFKVTTDFDEGFGILHDSHSEVYTSNQFQGCQWECPPVVLKDPDASETDYYEELVLPFEKERCKFVRSAGGKGSSLALLTELSKKTNQFIVPRGLVIPSEMFGKHLSFNETVSHAVKRLEDVASTKLHGDLKTECKTCTEIFSSSMSLHENLKNGTKCKLEEIFKSVENIPFSVRSSAVGEDNVDFSSAGQMKTILGVKGIDNIFRAIIQCWASKFSFEAVQYARQNGQPLSSPMAVVIQEMVPSDFSGVMFTVDPVSGDPTYPSIAANFGLGETVVSSSVNPDTVRLKREKGQYLSVSEMNIGSKKKQIFMKAEGGTEVKNYKNQSEKSCLTKEWSLKIGEAGILIESCFGNPRDIEWAVYKDKLYILQARPITTLHKETDFELMHDQDTPVRSYVNDFWTTANVGEVYSGALSPLGISLVVGSMDIYGHIDQVVREGKPDEFCPYLFHLMPVMQKHIAMDILGVLLQGNEKEVTPVQRACEIALFGRPVITEEIHKAGIIRYGYASTKQKLRILAFIPKLTYWIPKTISSLSNEIDLYRLPLETYGTARSTWDGILNQMVLFNKVREVHGMTTFLSSFFNMTLMTTLKSGKNEWNAELYSDFATLVSSTGAESVDVPSSLQELAKTIASYHGRKFSSLSADAAYDLIKNDAGLPGKLFDNFMERHGHRGTKEFDVYSKSWRMDSRSLIHILQNIVRFPGSLDVSSRTLSTETVFSKIETPLTNSNKRILKYFLPRCRDYVCLREKSKSMLIKTIDWLRESCHHLGDLMVKEGMLPDKELVFFLTLEEIKDDVLESRKSGLVQKAIRRKGLHKKLNELAFPEIIKGIPKPIQVQPSYSSSPASLTLKGTPVCQGTVKARVVVALTLDDASKIQSGDILITHATDIGWSPYFPLLSGVVTVLGGLISHGAVIAREFGVPCIVAVENATTALKSGDIVILDGKQGTVTKVLDEEN